MTIFGRTLQFVKGSKWPIAPCHHRQQMDSFLPIMVTRRASQVGCNRAVKWSDFAAESEPGDRQPWMQRNNFSVVIEKIVREFEEPNWRKRRYSSGTVPSFNNVSKTSQTYM
jgi:hypothetical protein